MNINDSIKLYKEYKITGILPDQMTNKIIDESLQDGVDLNLIVCEGNDALDNNENGIAQEEGF